MTPSPEVREVEYVPTRREKLGWRLFPQGLPPQTPAKFKVLDCVRIDADVGLSFLDRLRILLTGHLRVRIAVEVDVKIGAVNVNSHSNVQPPRWLRR